MKSSVDAAYAERLRDKGGAWWKRALDVQRPYRMHMRRLDLGFTLDVGCGLGRNLANLGGGVGVDPNADAIRICRERGHTAFTPDELDASEYNRPGRFDAMLIAHVLEHLSPRDAEGLIARYLPLVRAGGKVVLITPQEAGYRSDPTHVELVDFARLDQLAAGAGLTKINAYSFPFPRAIGRWFKYNEFVLIARKP